VHHQEKINDLLVTELAETGEATNLTFSRWCNYTVPLELILSKILEKKPVPAACGGGQKNPTARGQKISSPKTPPFFARSPEPLGELLIIISNY